jgi:hypothetical protein
LADGGGVAALFGWQPAAAAGHLSCALCGRCAPFDGDTRAADPGAEEGAGVGGGAAAKSPKRPRVGASFDAEGAHRWFCPWVRAACAPATNSAATAATDGAATGSPVPAPNAAGWQRVLAALAAPPEKSARPSADVKPRAEALAAFASARAVLRNI